MDIWMKRLGIIAISATFASSLVSCGQFGTSDQADSSGSNKVVLGSGADRLPNQTPRDWVTYADHVVVVTVVDESEKPPPADTIKSGKNTMIERKVSLRVDKVLWSSPKPAQPAPKQFSQDALGWMINDRDVNNRSKFAAEDAPRIEVGHTYISAIQWEPERCAEGDGTKPASWRGLGTYSDLPYDNSTVGQGEMEGATQTAAKARKVDSELPDGALAKLAAGKTDTYVKQALDQAKPGTRKNFGPAPQKKAACS